MTKLLVALWLALLPVAVSAQPVQVTSGEHDGFTRLVLDYGSARDWQIGRTIDGYEVRLADLRPAYDLTGVYDLIGRGRLASVWADPETGSLRIGIGCACHAQPFEFRPGIVVIDLKDGPPPKASVFEQALDGGNLPRLADRPRPRPRPRPASSASGPAPERVVQPAREAPSAYDWTDVSTRPDLPRPATEPAAAPRPVPPARSPEATALRDTDPGLQPLRDVLLHQLSRGAARGVVEMAHADLPDTRHTAGSEAASVTVRLHDLPGVRINDVDGDPQGVAADGAVCVGDQHLHVQEWGANRPVGEQMSAAMAGLIGEFDLPDPDAERRAVRFLLFIGFGAEARQMVTELPAALPDAPLLISLGHIIDATPDLSPAFAGMAACDTAAALWALLGNPAPEPGTAFDRAAALRSFSALPVHLRRHLGPSLAARFVRLGDTAAADAVRDAILRAPGEAGPEVALMQARLDLDAGNSAQAERRIEPLILQSGPATPEALIALVETRLAQRQPVDPEQIIALEGMLHERRNSPNAARYAKALTLAHALSGNFDQAFAGLTATPDARPDVWRLLAETGPDSAVLAHAIVEEHPLPSVSPEVAAQLARRLSDLGFAVAARRWLAPLALHEQDLSARIALQENDARTALRLVAGSEDPAVLPLRIEALRMLGDEVALAEVLAKAGDDEGRWRAVGRARDWTQLAAAGRAPWRDVAAAATERTAPLPGGEPGPLARGQALLQDSQATRQAVADLLASVATLPAAGP